MKEPLFKEEQKFTQWWIWVLLIGVALIPIYGIKQQIIDGEPFGNKPMSDVGLVISILVSLALLAMFWFFKLTTIITKNNIIMKWFPFANKTIEWKDIESAKVVNYGFVGGWGVRYSLKYGMVYNIAGNKGLAIKPKNGKKYLIGTQKREEMELVVKGINQSSDNNQS